MSLTIKFRFCLLLILSGTSLLSVAQTPQRLTSYICKLRNGTVHSTIDSVQFYYSGNRGGVSNLVIRNFVPWSATVIPMFDLANYDSAINYTTPRDRFPFSKYKTFDAFDNMLTYTTVWDTEKRISVYTYDVMNRLKTVCNSYYRCVPPSTIMTLADSITDSFVYNSSGQVIAHYNNADRYTPSIYNSKYMEKFYYTASLLDSCEQYSYSGSIYTKTENKHYTYDINGRVQEIATSGNPRVQFFKYSSSGAVLLDSLADPAKPGMYLKEVYAYSGTNNLVSVSKLNVASLSIMQQMYQYLDYDASGNMTKTNNTGVSGTLIPDYRTVLDYNSNNLVSKIYYEQWNTVTSAWQAPAIDTEKYFYYGSAVSVKEKVQPAITCTLYPNPASSFIMLELNGVDYNKDCLVSIFNTLGALVMQTKYELSNTGRITIPVMENGNYYLRIKNGDNQILKPFTVSK